jgi:arylsulfatase A-like enzyme
MLLRLIVGSLAASFLGACGDSAPASSGPGLQTRRFELTPGPVAEQVEPQVLHAFRLADTKEEWTVVGAEAKAQRVRVGVDRRESDVSLMMTRKGEEPIVLMRSGKLDASRINQVDVFLIADRNVWLSVELVKDGKPIAKTKAVRCLTSPVAFHVKEHLLWPLPEEAEADALLLRFSGDAKLVGVVSVELSDRPPSSLAEGEFETSFNFEGVTRRGSWVTTARPIVSRARIQPDSDLVFDFVEPLRARRRGVRAKLFVSVEDSAGKKIEERWELPGDSDEASKWRSVRLPLATLSAGPAQVKVALEAGGDAACFFANLAVVEPAPQVRPSVLMITSDTHRADHIKAAGLRSDLDTPVLDALAARGVLFEDCFSSANSTNPSHTALMTGVHTRDVGIANNATPLTDAAPTLAEAFRELGYRTLSSVSIEHLSHHVSGLGSGFDTAISPFPHGERVAAETIDRALEQLEDYEGEPVFLWVHVFDAHAPYAPPSDYDRRYYESDRNPFDPTAPDLGIPEQKLAPELRGLRDLEFPRAQYRAEVAYLDAQMQRLFETPRFAQGAIAFLSDHGEHLGEHGVYFDHSGLFPQAVHIPLILSWPGAPAGSRSPARVMQIDVGKTLLAIAGAQDSKFPGRDLRQRVSAGAADKEPRFMISGNFTSAAIETPTHYLILTLADPGDPRLDMQLTPHQCFLFDRRTDPACATDVTESQLDTARELRAQLVDWLRKRRSLGWAGGRLNDPEFIAQLQKLGYVDVQRNEEQPLWVEDDCDWCKKLR